MTFKAYLEFFKRLADEESGEIFYMRASACQIVAELYRALSDVADKTNLRDAFVKLAQGN